MTAFFPFVQLELTHSIGPPAGRYVVGPDQGALNLPTPAELEELEAAGEAPPDDDGGRFLGDADVLLIQVRGAPPPKPRMFRRGLAPQVEQEEPRELSVTIATVIFATRTTSRESEMKDWLRGMRGSTEYQEDFVMEAMGVVNLSIVAYRACAADPFVIELSRFDPRAVRIGYGRAQDVALGEWQQAIGVLPPPPPRANRTQQLMPAQGMAAVLAGSSTVLESEELILRAQMDLMHGRHRAAAAGLQAGIDLLLGEVAGEVLAGKVQQQMEDVISRRSVLQELAAAARRGPLTENQVASLQQVAEAVGLFVDRRRYVPMGF